MGQGRGAPAARAVAAGQDAPVQAGMTAEQRNRVHELLQYHDTIHRNVEEIPNGVRTTTTTTRPELVATLRTHVREMARKLEAGARVRQWDPVFRDVFDHAASIKIAYEDIDGGIAVTETTTDESVVPIIRTHARKVSRFAAEGFPAAQPPRAGSQP